MDGQTQGPKIQSNIDYLLKSLVNDEKTKIVARISEYYDEDSKIFVFDFEPLIPVLGESETMDDAQKQAIAALKFFFSTEANQRNLKINLENIDLEFEVIF